LTARSIPIGHGDVVIAAITQLHQHLEPVVLIAAGLLARNARARRDHDEAVGENLARAGLAGRHRLSRQGRPAGRSRRARLQPGRLWLHHLHRQLRPAAGTISKAIAEGDLVATSVLSGNRNFEGRVNPDVRANYLASPPLVVAYALAGSMNIDITKDADRL
jgi:aconitate hydratase